MFSGSDLELVFVRHGETTWNAARRVQGQDDQAVLTDRGVTQARRVAGELGSEDVTALWSSDLQRAQATARPLAEALGLQTRIHSGLGERHFGICQGGPVEELLPSLTGIEDGAVIDADAAPPGGESLNQFYERVSSALDAIVAESEQAPSPRRLVIVAHGGSIRMALSYLAGLRVEQIAWRGVENGAVIRHRCSPSLLEECR